MINSSLYYLTTQPTPLFNTPDLRACFGGQNGYSLGLDEKGLLRAVETVLFPNSFVELIEQMNYPHIWKICTPEYPYTGTYYIDTRFNLQKTDRIHVKRAVDIPSSLSLIAQLNAMEYCAYIWGGNFPKGLELLNSLYPSQEPLNRLDKIIQNTWLLKGVDCSGLLYFITHGQTPRNVSSLFTYGKSVSIQNKNIDQMIESLQSLDLIVWHRHVVLVLDKKWVIESQNPKGLIRTKLFDRLLQLMKEKVPQDTWTHNSQFVARRWHPDFL